MTNNITGITLFGLTCAAAGALLYSTFQGTADRAKQSLLYRNNPPAEYSFPDPYGLSVDRRLSPEGKLETYVLHDSSKRQYLISSDMMPETDAFLKALGKRIYKMPKDEQRLTLRDLSEIQAELAKL